MNVDELRRHLEGYLGLREALGFQTRAARTLLSEFVAFIAPHDDDQPIRTRWAMDWACAAGAQRGQSGQAARLSVARGFLIYLHAHEPSTEVPPPYLLAATRRPKPFIFTTAQLQTLIDTALAVGPPGALRPYTLATVIGLLASTGLRVGEALHLTLADVDLTSAPPRLSVLDTKFHKSRLVPLHPTTASALADYVQRRQQLHYAGLADAFFVAECGRPLTHAAVEYWFRKLCQRCGIITGADGIPPCPRTLRHTFAVWRMREWYRTGQEVTALLPTLSVYLGHLRPEETFWYLTAVPELLLAAANRFARYATVGGDQ